MIDSEQDAQLQTTLPNENLEYVYGVTAGIAPSSDTSTPLRQAGITVPETSKAICLKVHLLSTRGPREFSAKV
ncbi:MAG TPA: hypothetical protein V6C69_06775 [Trichormus sp.]|jgi:hypothetical protein